MPRGIELKLTKKIAIWENY